MKKETKIKVCVLGGVLLYFVLGMYKLDGIYNSLSEVKNRLSDWLETRKMHKEVVDLSNHLPLEDEEGAWYTKYHFIAHAGGEIDGKMYTNSRQAWELTYQKGNRVIDADLDFTTDGVLVLRHSWGDNLEQGIAMRESSRWIDANGMERYTASQTRMDYDTFKNTKLYYKYDTMSCEDMLVFMEEHKDLYVACDIRGDALECYWYLVDLAVSLKKEEVLDRIIVSLYDYGLYEPILEIYQFENFTIRQFYASPNNYYELVDFCLEKNIHTVNISSCYMDDEGVKLLNKYGIWVYVAVVDYISDMKEYSELGADGAVTNYLYEVDWQYVGEVQN